MKYFCISSVDNSISEFLQGYAFTQDKLIVNNGGYNKYRKDNGKLFEYVSAGRFLLVERAEDSERINIKCDSSGQSIVYYYNDNSIWIISNSLRKISERMYSLGLKIQPYTPAADVFKNDRLSLYGGQVVSNNTVIEGVKVLPINFSITASVNKASYCFSINKLVPEAVSSSYEEFLINFVGSWRGRLQAISSLPKNSFLALSGGVDSRAILALWSQSNAFRKLNCHSHKKYEFEYDIAKRLSKLSGENFGGGLKAENTLKLSSVDSYELSMNGNAGIKTNYGFREKIVLDRQVHFIGGCAVGSSYMRKTFEERRGKLVKQFGEVGANVANEILGALNELKIDQNDPWAMFHHYYNFRARYHYGNDAYTQFGSIQCHPLLDHRLHSIASYVDKKYVEENGLVRDVIKVADERLLSIEFDSPDKVKAHDKKLSSLIGQVPDFEYECYYDYQDLDLLADDVFSDYVSKGQEDKGMSDILKSKKESMVDTAILLGFKDSYIKSASEEILSYKSKVKLRKSGVLLGLSELFSN